MTDWQSAFDEFLATDPTDVGCDEAMRVLEVYVDLVSAGLDAADRMPGVAAHLKSCGPCQGDYVSLLGVVTDTD